MDKFVNPEVAKIFEHYPEPMRQKLMRLRQLIIDTALDCNNTETLEETLKWGEPSYLIKGGSTIRVDWKHSAPEQYALIFTAKQSWSIPLRNCTAIYLSLMVIEPLCFIKTMRFHLSR